MHLKIFLKFLYLLQRMGFPRTTDYSYTTLCSMSKQNMSCELLQSWIDNPVPAQYVYCHFTLANEESRQKTLNNDARLSCYEYLMHCIESKDLNGLIWFLSQRHVPLVKFIILFFQNEDESSLLLYLDQVGWQDGMDMLLTCPDLIHPVDMFAILFGASTKLLERMHIVNFFDRASDLLCTIIYHASVFLCDASIWKTLYTMHYNSDWWSPENCLQVLEDKTEEYEQDWYSYYRHVVEQDVEREETFKIMLTKYVTTATAATTTSKKDWRKSFNNIWNDVNRYTDTLANSFPTLEVCPELEEHLSTLQIFEEF